MTRPRDTADRLRKKRDRPGRDPDGFLRQTFKLAVDDARTKAREILSEYPAGGYMTIVERWRQISDGRIEFTIRRLPTSDSAAVRLSAVRKRRTTNRYIAPRGPWGGCAFLSRS
jgi:hypothetical protein